MEFNYVDLLLLLIILVSVLAGWQRGFIRGLLDLVRWVGSLIIGLRYYQPVARWLAPHAAWPEVWNRPIAFIITAALAGVLIQLVGHLLIRKISEDTHRSTANRLLGTLPGFVSGVITAAITASLLLAVPLPESFGDKLRQSALANRLAATTEQLDAAISPIFDEAIQQTLNRLTIKPGSDESVKLPFVVANTRPRPDLESQMLEMVNRERVAAGLKPLAPDPELTEVARRHSADMFARGYFSHNTPEGLTPFDRMHEAGVQYLTAGENLALAPTVSIAHTGLMHSPGHRANILRPQFGRVGIGIMDGGMRGIMVSQEFRN